MESPWISGAVGGAIFGSVGKPLGLFRPGVMHCHLPTSQLLRLTGLNAIAGGLGGGLGDVAGQMFEHGRVNWAEVLDAARSGAEMGAAGFLAARAFYSACFAGDMLVLTRERGAVRWDQLREGEEVWSQDEFDPHAAGAWKRVEEIFRTEAFIWKLRVAGQEIKTTDEHPFWVVGKGWVPAKELQPGDRLRGHDGERYPVESIEPTDEFVAVYNARIAEYHTYFVQAPGGGVWIWAHNAYKVPNTKTPWDVGRAVKRASHAKWGTFYKSGVDGTWWARDLTGHGGSGWKVFRETSKGLEWVADADRFGNYIVGKHKSAIGRLIPWPQLRIQ